MGEEEDVVAALFGERVDGFGDACPGKAEAGEIPFAELESVDSSLADEELQKFKFCHGTRPEVLWVVRSGICG